MSLMKFKPTLLIMHVLQSSYQNSSFLSLPAFFSIYENSWQSEHYCSSTLARHTNIPLLSSLRMANLNVELRPSPLTVDVTTDISLIKDQGQSRDRIQTIIKNNKAENSSQTLQGRPSLSSSFYLLNFISLQHFQIFVMEELQPNICVGIIQFDFG